MQKQRFSTPAFFLRGSEQVRFARQPLVNVRTADCFLRCVSGGLYFIHMQGQVSATAPRASWAFSLSLLNAEQPGWVERG